jgi:hypothetical protein
MAWLPLAFSPDPAYAIDSPAMSDFGDWATSRPFSRGLFSFSYYQSSILTNLLLKRAVWAVIPMARILLIQLQMRPPGICMHEG